MSSPNKVRIVSSSGAAGGRMVLAWAPAPNGGKMKVRITEAEAARLGYELIDPSKPKPKSTTRTKKTTSSSTTKKTSKSSSE